MYPCKMNACSMWANACNSVGDCVRECMLSVYKFTAFITLYYCVTAQPLWSQPSGYTPAFGLSFRVVLQTLGSAFGLYDSFQT